MMFKPMLAHKIEDKRSSVIFPGYVQPKLDGVRCLLTPDGFFSRNGKKICGVPELEEHTMSAFNKSPPQGKMPQLDGELYSHDLTFQQVVASVRRTKNISEDKRVQYHIYDVAINAPWNLRCDYLSNLVLDRIMTSQARRIHLLQTYKVLNWDDIEHYMKQFISDGYEGLMYRHPTAPYGFGVRSKYLLKYKKMKTEDVICIGYKEGKGKNTGMLGALECVSEDGSIVWVGTGFDDMQRIQLWFDRWNLKDKKLTIKYQEKTDSGVSRFPVFVCWRDYE